MSAKLTKTRGKALENIGRNEGRSGQFWYDLGISVQTLASAERAGLLRSEGGSVIDDRVVRRRWFITPAGRTALAKTEAPVEGKGRGE